MGWLSAIPIIGDLFKETSEIVKEIVVDKDAQNRILEKLEYLKLTLDKDIYVKELETKTVPWVDGLHKMARTVLNVLIIIAVVVLSLKGVTITPEIALVLGGGNVAYQLIKGKGK